MKVLLVSPATPDTFWSYKHILRFVARKAAFPPLGLLTVAALLPREWELKVVDLDVCRLTDSDLDWADYVLISAMLIHEKSVREIAARCASLGKPVIAGGPLFTTSPERFPEIPHLVVGEAEELMPELCRHMLAGTVRPEYRCGERPALAKTPLPRWDLIDFRDYATMSVQYSRGCPFNCEFCDIVEMYGRVPRVKTTAQMIGELDVLVDAGWRGSVFIVDDNFIGHKQRAKDLLRAIIGWRQRRGVNLAFTTEASLNLVDDPDLLDLLVQAGVKKVFIGLETPQESSLTECAKTQNTCRDLVAAVKTIQSAGIEVLGGFILGFDSDSGSIFERQRRFIQESGVVTAMVGLLTALPHTRLFARLKEEGRILGESTGNNMEAFLNFVPKLDRKVLVEGYRSLVQNLYSPKVYYARALTFLRQYRSRGPRAPVEWRDVRAFFHSLWTMGVWTRGRREYWKFMLRSLLFHPRKFVEAATLAILGHHFRMVAARL
jgi:radical SAM superfamily enzyme YgiQ (UPF0313 family)